MDVLSKLNWVLTAALDALNISGVVYKPRFNYEAEGKVWWWWWNKVVDLIVGSNRIGLYTISITVAQPATTITLPSKATAAFNLLF